MPYNFELTFVQPLLADLDNGIISGADSWANAVTKYYIATIQQGLPQGVPPVLPAPGLNPTAPPPFIIGASPFTTANTRRSQFYDVVHAYFQAKELSLQKGSILGLAQTVKQLTRKIKRRQQQITRLAEEIKLVREELKQLPTMVAEIEVEIQKEIAHQKDNLKSLFSIMDEYKATLDVQSFKNIFADELALLDVFKNFNVKSVSSVRDISLFISTYGTRVNSIIKVTSDQQQVKNYIRTKLFGIGNIFLKLADGIIDPTKIIDFIKVLVRTNDRLQRLYQKIERLDVFIRYIQPKLNQLELKKEAYVTEIKVKLQQKLTDAKKLLEDRTAEYIQKRKSSKSARLYKKSNSIINKAKKTNKEKIKKRKDKIKKLRKILKLTNTIVGEITTLIESGKLELTKIQNEIKNEINFVQQLVTPPTQEELQLVTSYLNNNNTSSIVNTAILIMVETGCNFKTFKTFFERERSTVKEYINNIHKVDRDIRELSKLIKEFRDANNKPPKTPKTWLGKRFKSVKDAFKYLFNTIQPSLQSIADWIQKQIKTIGDEIEKSLKKFGEDLEIFAINLLPLKSDVQDPKDKKAVAESKRRRLQKEKAEIKDIMTLTSYSLKMAKGISLLSANIAQGNYQPTKNEQPVKLITDNYFLIKKHNKKPNEQDAINKQKQVFKNNFDSLITIDLLITSLIETFKDIKQTDFLKELNDYIQGLSQTPQTLIELQNLVKNPPKNVNDYLKLTNSLILPLTQDISTATKITYLEKKYLSRSRQAVNLACSIKKLENTKTQVQLLKVKKTLDANQSFIILGLNLLIDEIKKFIQFINRFIKQEVEKVKLKIKTKTDKHKEKKERDTKTEVDRKINVEAPAMSFAFGLAARLFWTGASWVGPTGTTHQTFNVGIFKPIKAKSTDGASTMVREMARGFESQLITLQGIIIPPAPTGITPFPFVGYK